MAPGGGARPGRQSRSYPVSDGDAYLTPRVSMVKHRITVTLEHAPVKALDARPGASRSQKLTRLPAAAPAAPPPPPPARHARAFHRPAPDAPDLPDSLT